MDTLAVIGWPILDRFELGPVAISPHGIGIAIGYLLGSWWMLRLGPKRGLKEEHMGTILLWALVGAIVGARVFYVAGHFGEFDGIGDMIAVWRGGISLIGGILGAVIVAYPFMRKFGYGFARVMDAAAVGLAFGIIFGRIGDLVIGDHLGTPTDFLLGFSYEGGDLPGPWQEPTPGSGQWVASLPEGHLATLSEQGATLQQGQNLVAQGAGVHNTALYDLFIATGLFLLLLWMERKPRRPGVLIATWTIVYGTGRLVTDFLRIDKTWVLDLTGSQWAAIGAMAVAIFALIRFRFRPEGARASPDEEGPTTAFAPPGEPGAGAGGPFPPE